MKSVTKNSMREIYEKRNHEDSFVERFATKMSATPESRSKVLVGGSVRLIKSGFSYYEAGYIFDVVKNNSTREEYDVKVANDIATSDAA